MKLCGFEIGLTQPFFLIAGPCVIESRQMAFDTAGRLCEITSALGIPFIYKSSFDKANRSSGASYRGPGIEEGLQILSDVRAHFKVPVLTDVHDKDQVTQVAAVVDVLVQKARRAAEQVGAKGLVLGGGVAANSLLRERFLSVCTDAGIHGFLPSREMCTDNAAMIAAAGWHRLRSDGPTSLDAGAYPNLRLQFQP